MSPIDLGTWRQRHAKLTQREAADRAGIPQAHANAVETHPDRATLGALRAYVTACGGELEVSLTFGGVRRLLVLLAVLLAGCSAAGVPEGTPSVLPPSCDLAVDPAPEIDAAAVASWTERWSAATGCSVGVAAGGVPMVLVDDLFDSEGRALRGQTQSMRSKSDPSWHVCLSISLRRGHYDSRTIGHELGHALGADGHTSTGIMASPSPDDRIDAESLEAVCATAVCTAFAPEVANLEQVQAVAP